jgi:hypothetical protein
MNPLDVGSTTEGRLEKRLDQMELTVSSATAALIDVIDGRAEALSRFRALKIELQLVVRSLPIQTREDGSLDLSGLPTEARARVERLLTSRVEWLLAALTRFLVGAEPSPPSANRGALP